MNLPPPIMWNPARTDWDGKALMLLEAFQMYEDSLCSGCGQSSFHALNVANTREFRVDSAICLGCNVREIYAENHAEERAKGLKVFVVNAMNNPVIDESD